LRLFLNYVKELTLNPSLEKKGNFSHLLFAKEGGKRVELFNLSIATQLPYPR
jgi:hypothetical protein